MDYDVAGRLRGVLFGVERYYLETAPERPRYFFNENGSLFEVRSTFSVPVHCRLTLVTRPMIVIQVWTTGLR